MAAIRAAQLGMRVACIERATLGGTCLNVGCIPSKALLDSSERYHQLSHGLDRHGIRVGKIELDLGVMMGRKREVVKALTGGVGLLFRKNKVEHVQGCATIPAAGQVRVTGADGATRSLDAERILIATGSAPIELPGLKFDETHICSSTGALAFSEVPQRLVVVGGGYIGLELSSVWRRLGSEVLVLEFMDRILGPSDQKMAAALQKQLERQGIEFRFKTVAEKAEVVSGKVQVHCKTGEKSVVEQADRVLVAVGRRPVTDKLGLAEIGVEMTAKGFIKVDPLTYQTSVAGLFAIGDVIGGIMLAHKAEAEGVAVVERMAGEKSRVNYAACPSVVYTHPELAQVGLNEAEAAADHELKIGEFPFAANGRARAMGQTDGMVKVIADARTDRLLGVHILGPGASELIGEATVAMEFAASAGDLAGAFCAHPTLAEAIKEAALASGGAAIHK